MALPGRRPALDVTGKVSRAANHMKGTGGSPEADGAAAAGQHPVSAEHAPCPNERPAGNESAGRGTSRRREAVCGRAGRLDPDREGDGQTVSERQMWWRPRLQTIDACPRCLQLLDGFAEMIRGEEMASGRWPEHAAADLTQRALCHALEGRLKRPETVAAKATARANGHATKDQAKRARRACPDACDPEAIKRLCKRIRNDCRSSTRTRHDRDRKVAELPPNETRDLADRVLMRVDLEAAVARLPDKRRQAFVELGLKGRDLTEYAAENGITENTAQQHLKLARRDLRAWLPDYREEHRRDGRGA